MGTLFTILIMVCCVLLSAIILIQNPKGGGLATGFQGANQFGGVRRTTEALDKATWILVVALLALSVLSSAAIDNGAVTEEAPESNMQELVDQEAPLVDPVPTTTQDTPQE